MNNPDKFYYRCVLQQSTSDPDTHRPQGSAQPPRSQTPLLSPESELLSEHPVPAQSELGLIQSCSRMRVELQGHKVSAST